MIPEEINTNPKQAEIITIVKVDLLLNIKVDLLLNIKVNLPNLQKKIP